MGKKRTLPDLYCDTPNWPTYYCRMTPWLTTSDIINHIVITHLLVPDDPNLGFPLLLECSYPLTIVRVIPLTITVMPPLRFQSASQGPVWPCVARVSKQAFVHLLSFPSWWQCPVCRHSPAWRSTKGCNQSWTSMECPKRSPASLLTGTAFPVCKSASSIWAHWSDRLVSTTRVVSSLAKAQTANTPTSFAILAVYSKDLLLPLITLPNIALTSSILTSLEALPTMAATALVEQSWSPLGMLIYFRIQGILYHISMSPSTVQTSMHWSLTGI